MIAFQHHRRRCAGKGPAHDDHIVIRGGHMHGGRG
jgi:hypothetical protein